MYYYFTGYKVKRINILKVETEYFDFIIDLKMYFIFAIIFTLYFISIFDYFSLTLR